MNTITVENADQANTFYNPKERVAFYNPNSYDAIISAALLQTNGWTVYSANECALIGVANVIGVKSVKQPYTCYWLGLVPTEKHFRKSVLDTLEIKHTVFLKGGQVPSKHPFVIKDVTYVGVKLAAGENGEMIESELDSTIFSRVCQLEGIQSSECHLLGYMVDFFTDQPKHRVSVPIDILAVATANAVRALTCLKSKELFVPIPLNVNDPSMSDETTKAMVTFAEMLDKAKRTLSLSANYDFVETQFGNRRIVRTFEKEDWWFIRRLLNPNDIGINTVMSSTGVLVDATNKINIDLGLKDHITIIS